VIGEGCSTSATWTERTRRRGCSTRWAWPRGREGAGRRFVQPPDQDGRAGLAHGHVAARRRDDRRGRRSRRAALLRAGRSLVAGDELFVADTNNHRIVWADLASGVARGRHPGLEPPVRGSRRRSRRGGPARDAAPRAGCHARGGRRPARGRASQSGGPLSVRVAGARRTLFQARARRRSSGGVRAAPAAVEPGAWHVELSFAWCTEGEGAMCVPAQRAWCVVVTVADDGAAQLDLGVHAG